MRHTIATLQKLAQGQTLFSAAVAIRHFHSLHSFKMVKTLNLLSLTHTDVIASTKTMHSGISHEVSRAHTRGHENGQNENQLKHNFAQWMVADLLGLDMHSQNGSAIVRMHRETTQSRACVGDRAYAIHLSLSAFSASLFHCRSGNRLARTAVMSALDCLCVRIAYTTLRYLLSENRSPRNDRMWVCVCVWRNVLEANEWTTDRYNFNFSIVLRFRRSSCTNSLLWVCVVFRYIARRNFMVCNIHFDEINIDFWIICFFLCCAKKYSRIPCKRN